MSVDLFINEIVALAGPLLDAFGEPQFDFEQCIFDRVGAVAQVLADVDAVVAADGAGQRVEGVGLAEHLAPSLDGFLALPHHADHGAGQHVGQQAGEELLFREVGVVLLEQFLGGVDQLEALQLVAALLEAADDVAYQAALDAVWFDHDVRAFGGHCNEKILHLGPSITLTCHNPKL